MFCNRKKGSGFRVVVAASPQIYMGRCPKVCGWQVSLVSPAFPAWGRCPVGADRTLAEGKRAGKIISSAPLTKVPERRKKGSQPRLAALGSPFQGKGLAWTLPPSYGRRCPEGAEVGWGSGMKKSGKIVSSASFARAALSPYRQSKYTHMWKKNNDGQSLPLEGKVASKASRIGY